MLRMIIFSQVKSKASISFLLLLIPFIIIGQYGFPCYSIIGSESSNGELTEGSVIWELWGHETLEETTGIWINGQHIGGIFSNALTLTGKRKLKSYFKCIYAFEDAIENVSYTIRSYELPDGSVIYVVKRFGDHISYFIYNRVNYIIKDCDESEECRSTFYHQSSLEETSITAKMQPDEVDIVILPAIFEVTQELYQSIEGYNELEVIPAVFEDNEEIYLNGDSSICANIPVEYLFILDSIEMISGYNELTIIPNTFETVTEQVLVRSASIQYDTIQLAYMDSILHFQTQPAYESFEWQSEMGCVSTNAFDCMQIDTVIHESNIVSFQVYYIEGCPEEYEQCGNVCIRSNEESATFETITREILAVPTHVGQTIIQPEYFYYNRRSISENTPVPENCIVQDFDSIWTTQLVTPETIITNEIPSEYIYREYEKLISSSEVVKTFESSDTTLYGISLIDTFKLSNATYICAPIFTEEMRNEIISQLILFDYIEDPNILFGSSTFWDAIFRFQEDFKLPIGNIDMNTLTTLGIN